MFVPHRKIILTYHTTHRLQIIEVYSADTTYNYGTMDLVTHKYAEPIIFKAELDRWCGCSHTTETTTTMYFN